MRLLVALALLAFPAFAEPETSEKLKATKEEMARAEARATEIEAERGRVEVELKGIQKELIGLADTMQRNESGLLDAEDKIKILNRELEEKSTSLAEQQARLSAMLQAAVSLSHTPPEAAVMMPGTFGETVKAARVLASLSSSIRAESESILEQVTALEELKHKVQRGRDQIGESQHLLVSQQQELGGKLSERQKLASQLMQEQADIRKRLDELAKAAKDMEGLVQAVETARLERKKKEPADRGKVRSMASAKGGLKMPAAGKVSHRFGEALGRNETSKGVVVKTRSRAQVVAPFDGEVVFTGPFLTYGNMVILRHSDDFHTLLAGFAGVDVSPGQFLLEGEPIGAMGEDSSGADLYVELRHHNQPIDPAPWITAFK